MTADEVLLAEDALARQRALEAASFLVEAPAGAGKTELLTQRYLRLLASVDEPEEVVALTFTNKAAGEMRDRILGGLALGREAGDAESAHRRITQQLARIVLARSAERGWDIEVSPGRLRVTTIDALCAGLARQMPLLSRFGSQPGLAEDAAALCREAARRTLDALEEEGAAGEALFTLLEWADNDQERLIGLIGDMLARREQWGHLLAEMTPEGAMEVAFGALIESELAAALAVLHPVWQSSVMASIRRAAGHLNDAVCRDWAAPLAAEASMLSQWQGLVKYFLTTSDSVRRQLTVKQGFPPGAAEAPHKAAFLALLEALEPPQVAALVRLRRLPVPDAVVAGEEQVLRATVVVLRRAAAELWLLFRERNEVDFVELSMRAIEALGNPAAPSDLAERLDYRLRHLLVDEFQDTSPTQVRLIEALTRGWSEGDGHSLFLVGDPMQSIYRFREADVGLFLAARQQGIGGVRLEVLQLRRNNRSCPEVVEWINGRFPRILPRTDDPMRGEVAYRSFAAGRSRLPGAGVFVHPLRIDDAAETGAAEAEMALNLIRRLRAEDPDRQIAVLGRNRNHLRPLLTLLRGEAGLRCTAVELDPLAGRQVVEDLVALTRALHHRGDRLHWVAVLRAPWCGLSLVDLQVLLRDSAHATVWELLQQGARLERVSEDGRRRLAGVRAVFEESWRRQGQQPRREWVETAWRRLEGPQCLSSEADRLDAKGYFDRLEEIDRHGFDLDRLDEDLKRLYAAPDPQADGLLQLMTMHKAKGLEFETVILLGLHRVPRLGDAPLLAWGQALLGGEEILLAAPMNSRHGADADTVTTRYDFLCRLEREREQAEAGRLLYVAATRTIRDLHILAPVAVGDDGALKSPADRSLLAQLWPALRDDIASHPHVVDYDERAPPRRSLIPPADFVPRLRRRAVPLMVSGEPPASLAPAGFRGPVDRRRAAALGLLAHACLEHCVSAPATWTPECLPQRIPGMKAWLRQRGWDEAGAAAIAAEAAALLAITLASHDGRWVLAPRTSAAAELALTKVDDSGTVATRVMDRSFVEDSVRWIVDYKTARPPEAELAAHAEAYRRQLEAYAGLFAGEGLPVRLGVLYLAYGKLVSLDYNRSQ